MQQVISHTDRDHAKLAPSAMKMHMSCLVSLVPLEKPIIKKDSEYADEGTKAHEYFERVISEGPQVLDEIEDSEMRQHVKDFTDLIHGIIKKIGKDNIMSVLIEEKVKFSDHIYGTVDVAILYIRDGIKKIYILDFKYGAGVAVYAEKNAQLLTYLAATMETHKWHAAEAVIAIYQPRNKDKEDPLDSYVVSQEEIKEFIKTLKVFEKKALNIINNKVKKLPKEIPGEHCQWCPRKPKCIAYSEYASVPAILELDNLAEQPTFPSVSELTDEQLINIVETEDKIKKFLAAVIKYVIGRCDKGDFPGYKLVAGKSQRKWNESIPMDALKRALIALGVVDPLEIKLKTITEIEKEIGKNKINDLVVYTTPAPKLVKDTDPRAGITNAVDLLDEIMD